MGLFTLFTSSFLKVGCSYFMYCIWKYYHYYHTVLGWCKVKQRQIYWFKNKNTLPDVGHIHAPIHHISLSCHWSSSQLHTECPTLGALRRKESCLLSSSCHLCLCPWGQRQADTKALFHPCSSSCRWHFTQVENVKWGSRYDVHVFHLEAENGALQRQKEEGWSLWEQKTFQISTN